MRLLQLPKSFSFNSDGGGVIHGSTCESFVCTLIAAREKRLKNIGTKEYTLGKLVVYCSDQTHFASCQVVGISLNNVRAP